MKLVDLATETYEKTWQRQLDLVAARQRGEVEDTLIVVEHPHVITLGRRKDARANVLAAGDVPVVEVERGGDATYHGPGQIVAYPIVQLEDGERDLHRFLRNLEEGAIRALGEMGVAGAGRREGATGVWIGDKKIASIGISCRKWVTFHGIALNVTTDLSYFARLRPCGFSADVMTSVAELGGDVAGARGIFARRLAEALGRSLSSR